MFDFIEKSAEIRCKPFSKQLLKWLSMKLPKKSAFIIIIIKTKGNITALRFSYLLYLFDTVNNFPDIYFIKVKFYLICLFLAPVIRGWFQKGKSSFLF